MRSAMEFAPQMLSVAYQDASTYSDDLHTQIGSILVDFGQGGRHPSIIGYGVNHFLESLTPTEEKMKRENKLPYFEHSERDLVYRLVHGTLPWSPKTSVVYSTCFSCIDCTRALLNAGVRRIIGHTLPYTVNADRWKASLMQTWEFFRETPGMQLAWYDGVVPAMDEDFHIHHSCNRIEFNRRSS